MDGFKEGTTPGGILQLNAVASVMAVEVPICHYQANCRCCTDLNSFWFFHKLPAPQLVEKGEKSIF
jgi:hypothetical protein